MKIKQRSYWSALITTGLSLVVTLPILVNAEFQATQTEVFTAQATVGGTGGGPAMDPNFRIKHTPIQGYSTITRLVIIKGTAGHNIVPVSAQAVGPGTKVLVKLQTRYFNQGVAGPMEEASQLIESNPADFQFQLPPEKITADGFEYRIVADELDTSGNAIARATAPVSSVATPDPYYCVSQVAGNCPNSPANAPVLIDTVGGRVSIVDGNPLDGESLIDIPSGVLKVPTQVSLQELALSGPQSDPLMPSVPGQPYALYKINSEPAFQGSVRLSVIYPDYIPTSTGWVFSGTPVPENQLSLLAWDGFAWRNIGGKRDQLFNTITARSGPVKYLAVVAAALSTAQQKAPLEKIITPYGDNPNAYFSGIDPSTKVEIFDVKGHRIRTLSGSPANAFWDGKNDSGSVVESGVYIYQFEESGERVSGVIAVAK